jgi:cytochrome c biogenesis protein ResB
VPAFRGNVMLPEGAAANFVFRAARDGFVLQELPFAIELKDFQVAYYDTGQPKSFVSQVLIHDREHLGEQPMEATIRVNHPLVIAVIRFISPTSAMAAPSWIARLAVDRGPAGAAEAKGRWAVR